MPTATPEQQAAIKGVFNRLVRGVSSSIAGLAGTGKTFVISELYKLCVTSNHFDLVLVLAPTGKATIVLGKKGIPARTVHSVAYNFKGYDEFEKPIFAKKRNGRFACAVIVDEWSMVPKSMENNLVERGFPMCCVGDPGQLPPVQSEPSDLLENPTYELKTIHRQRADNPIIDFAYCIREGAKSITDYHPGINQIEARSLSNYQIAERALREGVDSLICWKNRHRNRLNNAFREVLGKRGTLDVGEKIICLNNNRELAIYNGQAFDVLSVEEEDDAIIYATIVDSDGIGKPMTVAMEKNQFGRETTQPKQEDSAELFDYAYAITCHKAQGSQWNHVGVIGPQPMTSWQYTAVTRAENSLTVFY